MLTECYRLAESGSTRESEAELALRLSDKWIGLVQIQFSKGHQQHRHQHLVRYRNRAAAFWRGYLLEVSGVRGHGNLLEAQGAAGWISAVALPAWFPSTCARKPMYATR